MVSEFDMLDDTDCAHAIYVGYTGLILGLRPAKDRRRYKTFAPSQWETALLCNDVSHWLGANLESTMGICTNFLIADFRVHSLRQEWREILLNFAENATLHGLRYFSPTNSSTSRRWYTVSMAWHIEAEIKLPPFRRRHFQMHVLESKCMNFAEDFTEVCY